MTHRNRSQALIAVLLAVGLAGCATSPHGRLASAVELQQRAAKAYASGDLVQAQEDYEALTRIAPMEPEYWFRLGNIHVRSEQPQRAAEAYEQALRYAPSDAKAWHNLAIVRLLQAEAAFAASARGKGADVALLHQSAAMAGRLHELIQPKPPGKADASTPATMPSMAVTANGAAAPLAPEVAPGGRAGP